MAIAAPPTAMIFIGSFVVPLTIGIFCLVKYHKSEFMKLIGVGTIFAGAIVGWVNAGVIQNYYYGYTGTESRIAFTIIMVDFVFVPLLVFGAVWILSLREKGTEWKKPAILLQVALVLVLITSTVGSAMIPISKIPGEYSYSIAIDSTKQGDFFVYVPAPMVYNGVSGIADHFRVLYGDANISVVDTIYGLALNISFRGSFRMETTGMEGGFNDGSLKNPANDTYRIYYSSTVNNTIQIHIEGAVNHWGGGTDLDIRGSVKDPGWNEIEGKVMRIV